MFILPEKTSSIFAHGFDDVALPPHHSLKPVLVIVMPNKSKQIPISKCKLINSEYKNKPQVLFTPLCLCERLSHVAVLILTVVPLIKLA